MEDRWGPKPTLLQKTSEPHIRTRNPSEAYRRPQEEIRYTDTLKDYRCSPPWPFAGEESTCGALHVDPGIYIIDMSTNTYLKVHIIICGDQKTLVLHTPLQFHEHGLSRELR